MKIINVIICRSGVVESVESFPIIEEQLSQEIVEKAENLFKEWLIKWSFEENEDEKIQDLVDNGYWESSNYDSVSLVWSNINI